VSENKRKFEKPALSIPEQIKLLKARGLIIEDDALAERTLRYIGYYHFSSYTLNFQLADKSLNHHQFISGTRFEDVLSVYEFDRKLRLLVMDAIERIEIAAKSCIINEMSLHNGSHWFMDRQIFNPRMRHDFFLEEIQRDLQFNKEKGGDLFIRHYFDTYSYPTLPPVWMVFETLSFGTISRIFSNIPRSDQKSVAYHFGQSPEILRSWLQTTTYIRNLCAHHSRLWNRVFTIKPMEPKSLAGQMAPIMRFYAQAVMLQSIMSKISPESKWSARLRGLIFANPQVSLFKMGFPADWETRDVWSR
jgi:abortive infection bacteriophage resistance protein